MAVIYSLKDIASVPPWQVGEAARLLYQLQRAGQRIPTTWVLSAECFQNSLQQLSSREPMFADWPQILWQTPDHTDYTRQQLAKRLRRTLLGLPLNLPLQSILEANQASVVRLLPSLWLGEDVPSAAFTQIMDAPICWSEQGTLEAAIKQLWAEMVRARSLAYWEHWQQMMALPVESCSIHVAVIIQAVEPVSLSGTITVDSDTVTIQAIQGLPKGILESCPDRCHRSLANDEHPDWQPGYQDQSYQPADISTAYSHLGDCLKTVSITTAARDVMSSEADVALLRVARQLHHWAAKPLWVEWLLPTTDSVLPQIAHALWWPFTPAPAPDSGVPASHGLSGYPASPGQVTGAALVIKSGDPLPTSAAQQIVVASDVAPDWLPLLKTALGIVSETGGLASHAAILARELQLPAVVGVSNATQDLQTGAMVRLDGDRGLIETVSHSLAPHQPGVATAPAEALPRGSHQPHRVADLAHATGVWLNLSQPELAAKMAALPVAGVGLLRSEWLMLTVLDGKHPYQWLSHGQRDILLERLVNQLRPIARAFSPRPVHYRSLDIRSDEFAQLAGAPLVESNPVLGLRGAFSYQSHPEFFHLELEVLKHLQSEEYHNLHLVLPFVRTVEEVESCRQFIRDVGVDQDPHFELWMMAEVPSALYLLPQYVEAGIQGIIIGTSDLTQLLLGIDRNQVLFSTHFNQYHPAVEAAITQLAQQAHDLEIPCILCGLAPTHHSDFAVSLVQQGMSGISVDITAVEGTIQSIHRTNALHPY